MNGDLGKDEGFPPISLLDVRTAIYRVRGRKKATGPDFFPNIIWGMNNDTDPVALHRLFVQCIREEEFPGC